MLEGKRILIIGPSNYGYPMTVKEEIERMGGVAHLYDERNNPNTLEKIIYRLCPDILHPKMKKYYKKIVVSERKFKPHFVLFISPETVTPDVIDSLRNVFKGAKFILYMWDSMGNKNAVKIYKQFDKCLSFDSNDCKKYDMIFRPLFFSREFEGKTEKRSYRYDFGFIGTMHSDRPKIIYNLLEFCKNKNMSYFFYLYIPGRFMYVVKYITDTYFRRLAKMGFVHIRTLAREKVESKMSSTRYVVDINHPEQTGLTMRTIEMLGLKRKLITTNEHIKKYDFYNEKNQIVINRKSFKVDDIVPTDDYEEVDKNIYLGYRVDNWVREVFEGV